jgi:GTP cyclohydrolase I
MEKAFGEFLQSAGYDLNDPDLENTPARVSRMYADELLAGVDKNPADELGTQFSNSYNGLIIQRNILFNSLCAHHVTLIQGKVDIAYLPDGRVVGLSKLCRLVRTASQKLLLQESFTMEIADAIEEKLSPKGAVVLVTATHHCVSSRGVRVQGSETITLVARGEFERDSALRAEVLNLLKR